MSKNFPNSENAERVLFEFIFELISRFVMSKNFPNSENAERLSFVRASLRATGLTSTPLGSI